MVKSTRRNRRRVVCGADASERSHLKEKHPVDVRQTPPPVPRCAAPFQISIRAAAAALPAHFSSAHVSSTSTGVAYFNLFANTVNWAVPVLFEPNPCLRERKVRLLKAAAASSFLSFFCVCKCLLREICFDWSRFTSHPEEHGVTVCLASSTAFGSLLCVCWGRDRLLCCS